MSLHTQATPWLADFYQNFCFHFPEDLHDWSLISGLKWLVYFWNAAVWFEIYQSCFYLMTRLNLSSASNWVAKLLPFYPTIALFWKNDQIVSLNMLRHLPWLHDVQQWNPLVSQWWQLCGVLDKVHWAPSVHIAALWPLYILIASTNWKNKTKKK